MITFDFSDEYIKILSGREVSNGVEVDTYCTINIDEGISLTNITKIAHLLNPYIKDLNKGLCNVCFSSSLVLYKELLYCPGMDIKQYIYKQLRTICGIEEVEYNIAYYMERKENIENTDTSIILVAAYPELLIQSYIKLFDILGFKINSITVSGFAVANLVESQHFEKNDPAMIVVDYTKSYVNMMLFVNKKLSFCRYTNIKASDYDNSDDYVFEALCENIFRMYQFQKNREPHNLVQTVYFYGDNTEYGRITASLEALNISTSILSCKSYLYKKSESLFSRMFNNFRKSINEVEIQEKYINNIGVMRPFITKDSIFFKLDNDSNNPNNVNASLNIIQDNLSTYEINKTIYNFISEVIRHKCIDDLYNEGLINAMTMDLIKSEEKKERNRILTCVRSGAMKAIINNFDNSDHETLIRNSAEKMIAYGDMNENVALSVIYTILSAIEDCK